MTTMYKVQDGVPLVRIDRAAKQPRRKWPVEGMVVDQFFFVPGKSSKSVSAYISRITKNLPGVYTVRRCWAWLNKVTDEWVPGEHTDVGAVEGVGVWRTE